MKRAWALFAAASVAAALAVPGLASGVPSTSNRLGANAVAIARCDTDGVSVLQNLSGTSVVSVTVGSISSACAGGSLSANVNNGSANSGGTVTVPGGGGSVTVPLGVAVAVTDSERTEVVISGP